MADERSSTNPPGDGPYRTSAGPAPLRRSWIPWVVGGVLAAVSLIAGLLWSGDEDHPPGLAEVPAHLFDDVRQWPAPEADLPVATPLAPLLVADQPQALAVIHPREGAMQLRRGQSVTVRFNRPMVEGYRVGRPLEAPVLTFDPPVAGEARWTSRGSLSFTPAAEVFRTEPQEARLTFVEGLASLSGEVLADDRERVIVFDGAPRMLGYDSGGRVSAGAPLPITFDAPVNPATLSRELLAYEIGGGQRSLAVTVREAAAQPENGFRVDVRLTRALEPGAQIGIALSPRYSPWGGGSPSVMSFTLAPRPSIEGIGCEEGAAYVGQCLFSESPGRVIEIGPSLRLLATHRLADLPATAVQIRPALTGMQVRLAPHGPPQRRLIEIRGEWEPDQAYEVRLGALVSEQGEAVRAMPPIAVRSSGHPPELRVAEGRHTYEHDAVPELLFAAIHAETGDVLYRPVASGDELRALVSPAPFVAERGVGQPIAGFAPDARANRWGAGRYPWRDGARDSSMAVVGLRADPARNPGDMRAAFVQSTDLGVTVRANASGLLVWVTSLSTAQPVAGARITVADARARNLAEGTTDRDGVARIRLRSDPLVVAHALRVTAGEDRAALLLDPAAAVRPATMGLTPGEQGTRDPVVATVFSDRGAYRPGEGLHAKFVLRRMQDAQATPVRSGRYRVRLYGPTDAGAVEEREVRPSRYGTGAVDLQVPRSAALGTWRLDISPHDSETVLGTAEIRVAEFRQPTFRVDLDAIAGPVHAGDAIATELSATYLFGAPVTRGRARWSLRTNGQAPIPERWSRFRFQPVGAEGGYSEVASAESDLGAGGALRVEARAEVGGQTRTRLELEAEVTDSAGHTHATRRAFTVYPASVEVGLREDRDWVQLGAPLSADAIVIDHDGAPQVGIPVAARFVREGWHSWWEWSGHAREDGDDGAYQMRRDQRREVAYECALVSGAEPVSCTFAPPRPGTYVLEVEVRDAQDRVSTASRRVYVAGPDEHPDRDPPGAPIAVTATRSNWTVGETAELAFESPFPRAQALITIERDGVLHFERRAVRAGGNVIRVAVRERMVPNAFVSVTILKPRTGPPGASVDLDGPDLRFGIAELTVRPRTTQLQVALEVAARARPGTSVPVSVRLTDAEGRPVRGEVALWAVDEGTLRLTGYQVPDPTEGLYRARPANFAWEDLRRSLVSRIEAPPMPRAGGDGDSGGENRPIQDERERFDPTPLWAPQLATDDQGRATATIVLPERPTEYRVMAVALDDGARSGRASAPLTAEQPLVLRAAFPRFLTAGDRFEATVFAHNATDAPITAQVWATVGGERRRRHAITIPPRGELRIGEQVTVPAEGPLPVRFDGEASGESTSVREEIAIAPRGRFVRSLVFGAAQGSREIAIGLPENTPRMGAHAAVTVASHPFVGFESAVDAVQTSAWEGTEPAAAALLAACAYARMAPGDLARAPDANEQTARGRELVARLLALQGFEDGFGRWSARGYELPSETTLAVHALNCAWERQWVADRDALGAARERLLMFANGSSFNDNYGREDGPDRNAFALRVLSDAGMPQGARAGALHEQREQLSPYGLAQLAMALGPHDRRADTLIVDAIDQALVDRARENRDPSAVRPEPPTPELLATLLEASVRFDVARPRASDLAGRLLAASGGRSGLPWGHESQTATALDALSHYAALWTAEERDLQVSLDGTALEPAARTDTGAFFPLLPESLRAQHQLRIDGDDGALFFAIDGRWAVALGETDTQARGRRAALHRVYETPDGRPIQPGESVALGALVRVRLFVHTEEGAPAGVMLHDPLPAGFEAIDGADDTTPQGSLMALMGMGPDDDTWDGRAHHAQRSLSSIAHRSFDTEATSFYFERLPTGLQEYTYAIRATSVGEFTAPPAQLEGRYDREFVARSTVGTLRVAARGTE